MSKKLFPPKSPFDEIFTNLPFLIWPSNLKFLSFSETGACILFKSISNSLLKFSNLFFAFFLLKILEAY